MLLFGQYDVQEVVRALQGHFNMITTDDKIIIDYYQLRIKIFKKDPKRIELYEIHRDRLETRDKYLMTIPVQ